MTGTIILRAARDSRIANRLRYSVDAVLDEKRKELHGRPVWTDGFHAGTIYQVVKTSKWRMESDTRMSRDERARSFDTPQEAAIALLTFRKRHIDYWYESYAARKRAIDAALGTGIVAMPEGED